MPVSMGAQLMSPTDNLFYQLWKFICYTPEYEKSCLYMKLVKNVQNSLRIPNHATLKLCPGGDREGKVAGMVPVLHVNCKNVIQCTISFLRGFKFYTRPRIRFQI